MSDIHVPRPDPESLRFVYTMPDSRIVFDFAADEAVFERMGTNLVLSFDDNSFVYMLYFYSYLNPRPNL